ncbi:MAG: hypothetical protein AAFR24_22655 [Cyanobacteria bacterium J06627_3]
MSKVCPVRQRNARPVLESGLEQMGHEYTMALIVPQQLLLPGCHNEGIHAARVFPLGQIVETQIEFKQ